MIRLNADADTIRILSSSAIDLATTITGVDVSGATVIDLFVEDTNTDTVKNDMITAPSAGHRRDVSKITVTNTNADTAPLVKLYKYIAAVETLISNVVLLNGHTLQYENGEWTVIPTTDYTRGGVFTRQEALETFPHSDEFPETDPEVAGQVFHDTDKYTTSEG